MTRTDVPWGDILDFWFGETHADGRFDEAKNALWWGKSEEVDRECERRFGDQIALASEGALPWADDPHGRLALVILLDQLRRNVYRDTPKMYAEDARARALVFEGLAAEHDKALDPIQRLFFYLPLEHSETLAHQEECVALCRQLAEDVSAARDMYANFIDYAVKHRDIVARFGRFPHRNAILGRESTAEELAFLTQPGSSF